MVSAQSGKILNISSVWGLVGASCEVAYSASKGAVNAFTRALARELAPSHIQVNALAPGIVDTRMNAHLSENETAEIRSQIPAGYIVSPEEVAEAALRLLEMPEYFNGEVVRLDGVWT
jgi:3-oxoacyl-[acyl-carrier protein] reductase